MGEAEEQRPAPQLPRDRGDGGGAANERHQHRRAQHVPEDGAHRDQQEDPERIGERLNPLVEVPPQPVAVDEVLDGAERDEGVLVDVGDARDHRDRDQEETGEAPQRLPFRERLRGGCGAAWSGGACVLCDGRHAVF